MKKSILAGFILLFAFALPGSGQTLRVATYNVRNHNAGDSLAGNGWKQRVPVICDLVRYHDFDIFGSQEVLSDQFADLLAGLPGYSALGVGRDDGAAKGEFAPVFFNKDKFELLEQGHFWLGEITDRPNRGWDAALPRICSWGKFRRKGSFQVFYFFNTHFDHVGVLARHNSSELILRKTKEIAGKYPALLTGDFNVDQHNEIYSVFTSTGYFRDSYEAAPVRYASNGTFNGFRTDALTDSRIDHIFVTPTVTVLRYGVLTDIYWTKARDADAALEQGDFPKEVSRFRYVPRVPSDHFPVAVEVRF